jgi:hypothetical protein
MNYRKIWESIYGPIPKDVQGRTFDIHHIDGNRKNNSIENLVCLSIEDHYKIHLKQFEETKSEKEFRSLVFLSKRIDKNVSELTGWTVSEEVKNKIKKSLTGRKRPKNVVDKVSSKLKGYKWSQEQIESRRQSLIIYYNQHNKEDRKKWRENISKSTKGKKVSEKTKEKLSKLNVKLSDNEVLEIMDLIISGVNYRIISQKYNISPAQITAIKQKKTYKWLWN